MTKTARNLLAFACDAGAPALAHFLLPAASVGCRSAAEVVAAVDGAERHGAATLLHCALRSGCAPLLQGLLAWGAAHGYQWKVSRHTSRVLISSHIVARQAISMGLTLKDRPEILMRVLSGAAIGGCR